MLKNIHPTMTTIVLKTYNRIYKEKKFPSRWKTAIVIPIPKPGKDHSNPLNYRPISLTNCLSKLLEKMVNIRLMWYLESGNYITPIQSGFRNNRSTTDHLTQIEHNIHQSITNKLHTIVIFFDLTKAYDTAWQRGVLQRLYDVNLRGQLPQFISNFITNRQIVVRVGKTVKP
jgi:potassium voltage-gated channel Eag-related subfamily H protein 8